MDARHRLSHLVEVLLWFNVLSDDLSRNPHNQGPGRNVFGDEGTRSDDGTVAHGQMVEHDGAHTHEYLMADPTRSRDVGAWIDCDEVSKLSVMTDQDATVEERMATRSSMGGDNHA